MTENRGESIHTIDPYSLDTRIKGNSSDANTLTPYTSPSRESMHNKHRSQSLVVDNSETNFIINGTEKEYGKYTFKDMIEENATILGVFNKYDRTYIGREVVNPPSITVIYLTENMELKHLIINSYNVRHQKFGYMSNLYNLNRLNPGEMVPAGTIFAQSNNVKPSGVYASGINALTAFGSFVETAEDGNMVSTTLCERLGFCKIQTYRMSFGSRAFPLNIHGDDEEYKIFPDIGEQIGDNNILFATRDYNSGPMIAQMSNRACRTIQRNFDNITSVVSGGTVIDVTIHCNDGAGLLSTPSKMMAQAKRYYAKQREVSANIDRLVNGYLRDNKRYGAHLSPELTNYLVENAEYRRNIVNAKLEKVYKSIPIDEWMIDITVKHRVVPGKGYKLTGFFGGNKGVICDIKDPKDMPRDKYGRPMDACFDALSVIKRVISAVPYEHYINASRDQVERYIKENIENGMMSYIDAYNYVLKWQYLIDKDFGRYTELACQDDKTKIAYVKHILEHHIYVIIPNNHKESLAHVMHRLIEEYPPATSKLILTDFNGNKVESKSDFVVGTTYLIILEKTPEGWGAISTPRRNHYGVPAKLSSRDIHRIIGRDQPTRVMGEGEKRPFLAVCGPYHTKRIIAMSANLKAHNEVIDSILHSRTPLNIPCAFDDVNNLESNVVSIVKLFFLTLGIEIDYEKNKL
jgi:hypothetical protein